MREVAFFWKYDRLDAIGISSVSNIAKRIEFLSYIKRVPKDIRCLFKIHLHENMTLDDLERIESLEVLEVVQTSENPEEGNLVICRVIHPLPILNARTNGTYAVAGSKLDEEGLTYILQGSSIKLRLLSGVLRLMAKPDRTSARTLKLTPQNHDSVLTEKQLKLAKFAYDRGYYDLPKRIKITELAEQLGLARATISEHLTKIEGILMDDMFSSMTDVRLSAEQARAIVDTMEVDMDQTEAYQTESFAGLLNRIKENIASEQPEELESAPELDISDNPEEILKRIQEDIS
ncbi:MAG: helix-turn-helix domain-containing protein [Candidatus Poseidoniales archaeon]|nr:helix-turn-helix domain-containing protein [Candidatus Poseidoniales archaeon]